MSRLQWIVCAYVVVSIVTFFTYGIDKGKAIRGKRRISEKTLHLLELLGGWPGAILAQRAFAHKRRKMSFMVVFFGIVAIHLAGWSAWYLMPR
ncbi:MAG: DUF1294 domain-containing protein [Planctomycetota bacterium]|nr:DUF1294 domain-containing protein [Planctomycetota bacterium]